MIEALLTLIFKIIIPGLTTGQLGLIAAIGFMLLFVVWAAVISVTSKK
jgi:hypothetical protein